MSLGWEIFDNFYVLLKVFVYDSVINSMQFVSKITLAVLIHFRDCNN